MRHTRPRTLVQNRDLGDLVVHESILWVESVLWSDQVADTNAIDLMMDIHVWSTGRDTTHPFRPTLCLYIKLAKFPLGRFREKSPTQFTALCPHRRVSNHPLFQIRLHWQWCKQTLIQIVASKPILCFISIRSWTLQWEWTTGCRISKPGFSTWTMRCNTSKRSSANATQNKLILMWPRMGMLNMLANSFVNIQNAVLWTQRIFPWCTPPRIGMVV